MDNFKCFNCGIEYKASEEFFVNFCSTECYNIYMYRLKKSRNNNNTTTNTTSLNNS